MTNDLSDLFDSAVGPPTYTRTVNLLKENKSSEHGFIKLWLPMKSIEGAWICLFQTSWMHKGMYSICAGDDEIEAILSCIYTIRHFIDSSPFIVEYGRDEKGGIPLWPNIALSNKSKNKVYKLIEYLQNKEFNWLKK